MYETSHAIASMEPRGHSGWFSFGSAVQRSDAGVVLEAVDDTGRVARIGQQRHHVLTVLPGRAACHTVRPGTPRSRGRGVELRRWRLGDRAPSRPRSAVGQAPGSESELALSGDAVGAP